MTTHDDSCTRRPSYYMDTEVNERNSVIASQLINKGPRAYPTDADAPEKVKAQAVLAAIEHACANSKGQKKKRRP